MSIPPSTSGAPATPPRVSEVRYPLKQLLREVEIDRQRSALGAELLDQTEIAAIFSGHRKLALASRG
jgi:hypothetical protein